MGENIYHVSAQEIWEILAELIVEIQSPPTFGVGGCVDDPKTWGFLSIFESAMVLFDAIMLA
jgi:hypothetical protein